MTLNKALIGASLSLLFAGNAMAAVSNGNFSQPGLSGWQTLGDAAKNFGGAVLTTASIDFADDLPDDPATYNASGFAPAAAGSVEAFAGLAPGSLNIGGNLAYEGSGLKQSFSVAAGETLRFDWVFYTNEAGLAGAPDFAFVAIDGQRFTLASAVDASIPSIPFDWTTGAHTGVNAFSYTYLTGGISSVTFGVVDVGSTLTSSALWLDKVTLIAAPPPAPVPEPSTGLMLLAGLGLVGMVVGRRARHS